MVMVVISIAAVVVVIIPITITVPTAAFNIPPPVGMFPAVLPGLAQFDSPMLGFPAFIAVAFDSLVQTVIGAHDAFLALIIGLHSSGTRKKS
jgi:hypothetical protein